MSLLYEMMEDCVIMNATKTPDGAGGFETVWSEGPSVKVAVVLDNSIAAMQAEKEGVTSVYTLTTPKDVKLDFHDVIKRENGTYLRVTSNKGDKQTPKSSALNMAQVKAEKWELTT